MLRYLRRIRLRLFEPTTSDTVGKSLLESRQVRRYLLYALGEIALVVIGILIALQVNQWNNNRINKVLEKVYLDRFVDDLNQDLAELKYISEVNLYRIVTSLEVLNTMGHENSSFVENDLFIFAKKEFTDLTGLSFISFGEKLNSVRFHTLFEETNITFQEMLANGKVDLIRNEELKIAILSHYNQLEEKLELQRLLSDVRDEFVQTLVDDGISMYNNQSYDELDLRFSDKTRLEAIIENILFITSILEQDLNQDADSVQNRTKALKAKIEEYLDD